MDSVRTSLIEPPQRTAAALPMQLPVKVELPAIPVQLGATEPPAPTPARPSGPTLRDFVTDGSVAGLCDELARLTGVPVWLRDFAGGVIVPHAASPDGQAPGAPARAWAIVPEDEGRARSFALVERDPAVCNHPWEVPLRISTGPLGAIAVCLPAFDAAAADVGGESRADYERRMESIRRALRLLASSVADVCEAQVSLRQRVRELDALFLLSKLITENSNTDDVLGVALDLAMKVLHVEAGSIALIEDGKKEPVIRVSRGLSSEWVVATAPLSIAGMLRESALAGQIVSVADLNSDPRIAGVERTRAEGLVSLLSTGLLDQGRPIGLIRLYTHSRREFTPEEGELLRAIAEHSASAVTTARLRSLRSQDEAIKRQVRLAASVQRRMLPRTTPKVAPFDVAAHYAPSFELGGDFYDFLELGGHLGILVGDVVGKNVPAALLMASVRSSLRAHAQDVYDIDEVLARVNRALVRDTLDNEFATVWYGVADPTTLRLTYCAAGHDWPLLIRVPTDRPTELGDVQRLTADGMALGIDPSQKYTKGVFQLRANDVLVIFTDGVHDAVDFEGKRFGGTRLRRAVVDALAAEPQANAARIAERIVAQVRQHTGLAGRSDDLTLVVVRIGEPARDTAAI